MHVRQKSFCGFTTGCISGSTRIQNGGSKTNFDSCALVNALHLTMSQGMIRLWFWGVKFSVDLQPSALHYPPTPPPSQPSTTHTHTHTYTEAVGHMCHGKVSKSNLVLNYVTFLASTCLCWTERTLFLHVWQTKNRILPKVTSSYLHCKQILLVAQSLWQQFWIFPWLILLQK